MKNYNEIMKKIIDELGGEKKSLLLHSCCGPCSTAVIEKLKPYFDITVFYYNPNILPAEEYEKRKQEQKRLLEILQIPFMEGDYDPEKFAHAIKGKEDLPEGSERCRECYRFRLEKTCQVAKNRNFEFFTTTLSVSPHKNAEWINEILLRLEKEHAVRCLPADFKKENGYFRSIELAKKYSLYRQEYCGCKKLIKN